MDMFWIFGDVRQVKISKLSSKIFHSFTYSKLFPKLTPSLSCAAARYGNPILFKHVSSSPMLSSIANRRCQSCCCISVSGKLAVSLQPKNNDSSCVSLTCCQERVDFAERWQGMLLDHWPVGWDGTKKEKLTGQASGRNDQ